MKTYKYELYHQSNLIMLGNILDDMHSIHVHILRLHRRYYRMYGGYISLGRMLKHITKLKRRRKPHWQQLPSQAIQDVAIRIDKGYQRFFDYKQGKITRKTGRPKIKAKHKYNSWTFTQAGYKLVDNRIYMSCLDKWYTFWKDGDWSGEVKNVSVQRDGVGDYYICVVCDDVDDTEPLAKTGNEAGCDFGIKTFITLSDGTQIESPEFYKASLNDIRKAHRMLSRKQKGSHAWYRALRHLNRVYKKIRNRREDWFYKLALRLVRKYDVIAIETLNLEGMKKLWGRKVSDLAFGKFSLILEWTCKKYGKTLLKSGKWTATTKPCHVCGEKNESLTLADRQWTCQSCGTHHDRDVNAALNILRVGVPV